MSSTLVGAPTSASPLPLVPPTRRRVREALVAITSLLVVLTGALYVLAPASATLEASFGEIQGQLPEYDQDLTFDYSLAAAEVAERRRYSQTFYGSVESAGVPVRNARLTVKGVQRKTRSSRATTSIGGADRAYRARASLVPGRYRVTISLTAAGKNRSVSRTMTLRNNRSYRASVRVRESGIVTMLPVTSY